MGWTNVHPDFQNSSKNYFTKFCILIIRFIISEFYMAWRKNFTEIFTYWRGEVCPPIVQTVSLMSRLIKITFSLLSRLKNDT